MRLITRRPRTAAPIERPAAAPRLGAQIAVEATGQVLLLAAWMGLCALAMASLGWRAAECAQAAALVWASGAAALALMHAPVQPAGRISLILGATGLRMSLPLGTLAWLSATHTRPASRELANLILVHYLAALVLETWMALRLIRRYEPQPAVSVSRRQADGTAPGLAAQGSGRVMQERDRTG